MSSQYDHALLKDALDGLRAEGFVFGTRFINDARVRVQYQYQIKKTSDEILKKVKNGGITAREGAVEANKIRNKIMEANRIKTSDLGRYLALSKKNKGLTFEEVRNKLTLREYNKNYFNLLTDSEKKVIWKQIVESAGRDNSRVSGDVRFRGRVGKGLILFTFAVAVYNLYYADNKPKEIAKEAALLTTAEVGAAIGGKIAGRDIGGTLGILGGPADFVTVPIGIWLGGIIGGDIGVFFSPLFLIRFRGYLQLLVEQ